jgi:hypothetical protein
MVMLHDRQAPGSVLESNQLGQPWLPAPPSVKIKYGEQKAKAW